jgi:hypothetical protein
MSSKKRCVSGCKGLEEGLCTKSPRCTFFNGKHKYCRLSHKYKMSKPGCHVKLRMTKKNKVDVARQRLKEFFLKNAPQRKPTSPSVSASLSAEVNKSPLVSSSLSAEVNKSPSVSASLSAELNELMKKDRPSRSKTRGNRGKNTRSHAPSRR